MKGTKYLFLKIFVITIFICLTLSCHKQEEIFSEEGKEELTCFIDSVHLRNKAMSLLQEIPSTSIIEAYSAENLKKIETALEMMKKSIEESQKVND